MKRREFFKVSALASGGLMLSFSSLSSALATVAPTPEIPLTNFLKVLPDGAVFFRLTKHEMGQGVATSLSMIIAEELDIALDDLKIDFITANLAEHQQPQRGGYGTGGSTTVLDMYPILRKAGATARYLLRHAAAKKWGVDASGCDTEKGYVLHRRRGLREPYGALASLAAEVPVPEEVALKNEEAFTIIGKPAAGKLIEDIVTGRQQYGIDVRLPGMLYAVVARCPVYRGTLVSYDATETLAVAGVKAVVTTKDIAGIKGHFQFDIREGVAVVADSFWAARKGREKLKVEWDFGIHKNTSLEDFEKAATKKAHTRTDPTGFIGDANAVADLTKVKTTLRGTYTYPYQLHSTMEPLNCTAHFQETSCDVYLGVQAPHFLSRMIGTVFGLSQDNIRIHLYPSGGGFGRRWYPDAGLEALCISKAIGNLPVKMIWTREDDQTTNHAHCYVQSHYQAALGADSQFTAWYQKELRSYTWGGEFANPELTWIGYNIPNIRYDFEDLLEESVVQSCAWRSVVANAWAFGQECFFDEVAAFLKKDPLQFRLDCLEAGRKAIAAHQHPVDNDRLIRVLKLAAEKAKWEAPLEAGKGKGIAAYPYLHGNSYCAIVSEVSIKDNKVRVDKVTCAVDCGRVINPSGAKNQIEGGVLWGLTALFYGGIKVEKGHLTNTNFHQNKLMRMEECPTIEVYFVEDADVIPWGIGELSPPVIVPSVMNAVFNATGKRIRKLPLQLA